MTVIMGTGKYAPILYLKPHNNQEDAFALHPLNEINATCVSLAQ